MRELDGGQARARPAQLAVAATLRGVAIALGIAGIVGAGGCGDRVAIRRVVLISIDTLRADHLGCYGRAGAHTPTLDGLAERGALFERAISPTPTTLPSHTTLLTGRIPPQHGVRNNSTFRLANGVPTLAESARRGGFATAAFVAASVLDRSYGLARGFDVYDDQMTFFRADHGKPVPVSFPERKADAVIDASLAWLEGAPERFLLWVHLYDPHGDYHPPSPFAEQFADDPYSGEIAFADREIGRLLAAVEARYPDGATLVVATSDHGENLGEHGHDTHGYTIYEATQHVPLLIAGPGIEAGRRVHAVVELSDVTPTLLDLLDLPELPDARGESLVPLLRGVAESRSHGLAYVETLAGQIDFGWSPSLGVRSDRYKYVRTLRPELYDLSEDPRERDDIAALEPAIVAWHEARLEKILSAGHTPGAAERVTPSAEQRQRLESLGYVVSGGGGSDPQQLGQIGGPDPKDMLPQLQSQLGAALQAAADGDTARALWLFQSREPAGYFGKMVGGNLAVLAGRWELAEEYARAAIEAQPGSANAHLLLAKALRGQQELEAAEAVLAQTIELSPGWGEPLLLAGLLADQQADTARAEEFFRRAAEARVPNVEATWRLAALLIERHAAQEASTVLERLPEDTLAEPQVALRLADAEASAGRPLAAIRHLQRARAQHPDAKGVRLKLFVLRRALREQAEEAGRETP